MEAIILHITRDNVNSWHKFAICRRITRLDVTKCLASLYYLVIWTGMSVYILLTEQVPTILCLSLKSELYLCMFVST